MVRYGRFIFEAFRRRIRNPIQDLNTFSSLRSNSRISQRKLAFPFPFVDGAKRFYSAGTSRVGGQWNSKIWVESVDKWCSENPKTSYFSIVLFCLGVVIPISTHIRKSEMVPYSKRRHFVFWTIPREKQIGEVQLELIKSKYEGKIVESIRVQEIAHDILKVVKSLQIAHLDELEWEVTVVDDPKPYAFSMIGGKIVVFTGLLTHFKQDVEKIATIIGHEHC